MKSLSVVVIAFVLGAGSTSLAQTMVEYSGIAGKTAPAAKVLSDKINASTAKIATTTAAQTTQPGSTSASTTSTVAAAPKAGAQKTTGAEQTPAPPKPTPPAVFVLSNGQRIESDHYMLTTEGVQLRENGVDRMIPKSALNINATMSANEERGLHLMFPTSTSQMTVSF